MLNKFLTAAKMGEPVYISDVSAAFDSLDNSKKETVHLCLQLLEGDEQRDFIIHLPKLNIIDDEILDFVKSYFHAQVYNILSISVAEK